MEQEWVNKMLDEKYQAGFFPRVVGLFFDLITLLVTLIIFGVITTWWMYKQSNAPDLNDMVLVREYIWEHEFHLFVISWIVLAIVAILTQYVFPMFARQTVGMKMVGLHLRDENAKEVTKSQ
jgi:hypothetical protein